MTPGRTNGEPQCGPDDFATLTGALFDGTSIEGTDAIRLVQP